MTQATPIVNRLSKHLFWEINLEEIDPEKHYKFIITRVLQYGFISDWELLYSYYGLDKIVNTAIYMKDLDKKTASFLALISNTTKQNFLCYSTGQSIPKHWNF